MTSKQMRNNPLFMRNEFDVEGKWGFPIVRKQSIDVSKVELIAYSDTSNDDTKNLNKGVHFFIDDYRFESVYAHPNNSLDKLRKYRFLLTPDFSVYAEMNPWRQIESVGKSRWVGANWQKEGLAVIPTISWGLSRTFDFCFDGVEKGSVIAVGMIGCKHNKTNFLKGYYQMLNVIEPEAVICFGKPYDEMYGNIVVVDYLSSRRDVR